MSAKAILAITLTLAIAIGFALPKPDHAEAQPVSRVQMLDLDP